MARPPGPTAMYSVIASITCAQSRTATGLLNQMTEAPAALQTSSFPDVYHNALVGSAPVHRFRSFMRLGTVLVLALATTGANAQQVRRDPQAITILVKMVSATGWVAVAQLTDATASGTLTATGPGATPTPIVIKARPGNQSRMEIPAAETTVVRNDQRGKVIAGSESSPLSWHSIHAIFPAVFPFFSTAGDFNMSDVSISYLGTEQLNGQTAYIIDLQHAAADGDLLGGIRQRGTHVVVSVSATTFFPLKMQFALNSVNDLNASLPITRYWSNYQSVQGIYVPFLVRDFIGGNLFSTIQLDSVQWNVGLPDADFDTQ